MLYRIQWKMVGLGLVLVGSAHAGVIEFTDRDEWFAAVGAVTTIDFTGFPDGTFITDQYEHLGVIFTDGDDRITCCDGSGFPNDGSGLHSGGQEINLTFLTPQAYIAVDFPGFLIIKLLSQGELLYASGVFGQPGGGDFAGVVSNDLFDSALIRSDPVLGAISIDDLHFGVPAPRSLILIGLGALPRHRCRLTKRSGCRAARRAGGSCYRSARPARAGPILALQSYDQGRCLQMRYPYTHVDAARAIRMAPRLLVRPLFGWS